MRIRKNKLNQFNSRGTKIWARINLQKRIMFLCQHRYQCNLTEVDMVKLTIKNCNNIDNGSILIEKNKLNIKYGINGIGKSSIAKAILCSSEDKKNNSETLKQLKPFKCIGQTGNDPEIGGIEEIKNIKIFNEDYINEFVFQPDELLKGSFDIFIRNDAYEKGLEQIDNLVTAIRKTFVQNNEIEILINDLTELSGSFGKPTKNGIHGSSHISKALKDGNKVIEIVGLTL
jgi:hypothetical protein